MLKICMLLELDPIDFTPLTGSRSMGEHLLEKQIMDTFSRFNQEGKRKVMELLEIYVQIEKYTVSVSYTHLDVYKRQLEILASGRYLRISDFWTPVTLMERSWTYCCFKASREPL